MDLQISFADALSMLRFFTDDGRQELFNAYHEARAKAGEDFLTLLQTDWPIACKIIDLAANATPEAAYDEIHAIAVKNFGMFGASIALTPAVKQEIFKLHFLLRQEIDRPRGVPTGGSAWG